jgi:dynein assembly factor with WDR repeat domains 1
LVFLILPRPLRDLCSLQIDLLHLTTETDVEVLINQIVFEEPLISDSRKPQVCMNLFLFDLAV